MAITVPRSIDTTTAADALKVLYPQDRIEMLWKQRFPLLAEISKADEFTGSSYTVAVNYDGPTHGATAVAAQATRYASSYDSFAVTRAARYSVGWVDNEAVAASRERKGAHVKLLEREFEGTLQSLQRWVALGLYRDGGGSLGKVASVSSNTVTFVNKADVYNFSIGMSLIWNTAADGSGTTRSANDDQINAIDHDAGTITVDTLATSVAANDYAFVGSAIAQVTSGRHIAGLAAWNPLAAPGATAFFGVARNASTAHLSGHRLDNTSLPIREIISELAYRISYTGQANRAFVNPIQLHQLSKELESRVVRDPGGMGLTGFSGVTICTGAGDIVVYGDPACPENRVHVMDMSAIHFPHLRGLPHWMDEDGLKAARVDYSSGDYLQFGLRFWGNLVAFKPGCLGIGALATAL